MVMFKPTYQYVQNVYIYITHFALYRCKIPGLANDTYEVQGDYHQALINASIPQGSEDLVYDQCHIYVTDSLTRYDTENKPANTTKEKCSSWVYDTNVYKNTFTKNVSKFYQKFIFHGI